MILGRVVRIISLLWASVVLAAPTPEQLEFFEKSIRPVLAENCYSCHSSRIKTPMAGLRLDSRAAFHKGSDAGPIVVPGKPEESKLVRAVRGELPQRMPPTGRLKPEQVDALAKWVEMGAPWPEDGSSSTGPAYATFNLAERKRTHWAWQPVRKQNPPAVKNASWPLEATDRFLLDRIEQAGLKPSPEADPRVLIRRLFFDLTGLPPAPSDVAAFEKDPSQAAYRKLVDRLLESPRFGEHWARHWMDWVRYAESHGSEGDPDTPNAWYYRDYLIRALNNDVPYDQLIREHLAGDLLPNPRLNAKDKINESILGTAHLRMVEHGFQPVDPWEDRVKWADNQIDVFAKTFQGLTISCARCHDHKFDAISQKDFYALFGIFYGARPTQVAIDDPVLLNKNKDALADQKRSIKGRLADLWKEAAANLRERLNKVESAPDESPLAIWKELSGKQGDEFVAVWNSLAAKWRKESTDRREYNAKNFTRAWDLRGNDYENWIGHGAGFPSKPSPAGEFSIEPEGERVISGIYPAGVYTHLISRKHPGVIQSPRFKIETDSVSFRALGGNYSFVQLIIENYAVPRAGIYHLRHSPKKDEMGWHHWDTSFWKGFTAYFEFATIDDVTQFLFDDEDARRKERPALKRDGRSWIGAQQVVFHNNALTPKEEVIPTVWLLQGDAPGSADALAIRIAQLVKEAVDAWRDGRLTDEQSAYLDAFVRSGVLPNSAKEAGELVAEYRRLEAEIPVARRAPGVVQEPSPDHRLLVRGNHKNYGEIVPRGFLTALESPRYDNPRDVRLRLAHEIANPSNPFTARVFVNRVWRYLYGRGIVASVDNFGKLGEQPSHPELLDWLAAQFVEDGWSLKKLVRELVNSRAYQMSSTPHPDARQHDPANLLLSHMPVRRLEAEAIRDSILAVTGQIDLQMFGASVPVYYAHDTGKTKGDRPKGPLDGNNRRSVYLEIRRNATNPFLEVFDFPKPATTRGQRDLTNVPSQSLAMMNSAFVIEQSSRWAKAIAADGAADIGERVSRMFFRALGRVPGPTERDQAATLVADLAAEHQIQPPDYLTDTRLWRDFAQALFNLKEFLYIR